MQHTIYVYLLMVSLDFELGTAILVITKNLVPESKKRALWGVG